ncbi:MAG: hypothetical protein KGZ50_07600 [Peptococcaceae bacterium]|nr:hypothetical protein [Peptococcaceae bacterium]
MSRRYLWNCRVDPWGGVAPAQKPATSAVLGLHADRGGSACHVTPLHGILQRLKCTPENEQCGFLWR